MRKFYGDCLWEINTTEKVLYLTFDDGPDPEVTPFVLEQLNKFNAKATFFCIGKNVATHTSTYDSVIKEGHAIGNHTFSHIDGWKTRNSKYFTDISEAGKYINSNLFRPPFGHVTWRQVGKLKADSQLKTVLWSVLSADFDENTPKENCLKYVTGNSKEGSIVLFHDTKGASKNLRYALPRALEHFSSRGFRFEKIIP